MIKKINAVLALILVYFSLDHIITMSLKLFNILPDVTPGPFGAIIMVVFIFHALLSMFVLFFNKSDKGKIYSKLNFSTMEQRFTGIAMILLVILHQMRYYTNSLSVLYLLFDLAFVVMITGHIMSSVDNAFITLGIYKKWFGLIIRVIVYLSFIAALASNIYNFFYRFFRG